MSQKEIRASLDLLQRDWDIELDLRDFMLGRITDVADSALRIRDVTFHIPFLTRLKKYVLWKCHWPDCHNCCDRQGRLPLTSDDLIRIGSGLKYRRTSDFLRNETLVATHREPVPDGRGGAAAITTTMTTINLKRRRDETEDEDGTHIPCRFLDGEGGCSIHPGRPGVCYLYPFSSWLTSEGGRTRVHAGYQITGDCPGFYLADSAEPMAGELREYSGIIFDYSMRFGRTLREGFGAASFG